MGEEHEEKFQVQRKAQQTEEETDGGKKKLMFQQPFNGKRICFLLIGVSTPGLIHIRAWSWAPYSAESVIVIN